MDYQIKTNLPKSEVENRIAMNVAFGSSLSIFNYPNKFFYGKKQGDTFELKKVPMMFSRNSFAPVATIRVVENADGSIVNISTKLSNFTSIFLIIWAVPLLFMSLIAMPVSLLLVAFIMAIFYVVYRSGCNKIYEKILAIVS